MMGEGKKMGAPTLKYMTDPKLFHRNLRFALATTRDARKNHYLVDDDWVREFVELTGAGRLHELVDNRDEGRHRVAPNHDKRWRIYKTNCRRSGCYLLKTHSFETRTKRKNRVHLAPN
jgi:hypothetical protein